MKYLIALLIFFLSISVKAEQTVKIYHEFKEEPFVISYVWGMARGMMWANNINSEKGGNNLFCMPPNYVLHEDQIIEILESEMALGLKSLDYNKSTPIELIFLVAMEKMFPCV